MTKGKKSPSKHIKKKPWGVLIAIALAIVIGSLTGKEMGIFGITFYSLYDLLGKIFINALTLVVVPLVSASIITGIARIGSDSNFGRLGLKTFLFYLFTNFLAILIGVLTINLIHPGSTFDGNISELIDPNKLDTIKEHLSGGSGNHLQDILLEVVPSNVLEAFSKGNMLGLIFFSLLFGYAITRINQKAGQTHLLFWEGLFESMIHVTRMIMRFLPIGVFCLVAKVFAETGFDSLESVGLFFVSVLLGLILFVFVGLTLLLKFVGKVSPWRHFRAMAPALITAFSTSSSSASLPITLDCVEKRAGVSNKISSLVIPLGSSINLSGSALYEGMAALFIAQAFGLDLSIWTQVLFTFVTLLASMGVAGVPSGSLVAIIIILRAMGLPSEGIGLFIAVDRLLDMCRTTVNVFSDSCCAVLIAKTEGETQILTSHRFNEI